MKNYLTQNSKIKAMSGLNTYNWGIPAYKEKSGRITCPMASQCIKGCYASQGAYVWSNVSQAFQSRYELSKQDNFVSVLNAEIKRRKSIQRIRIHDSGDFYSRVYLEKWLEIIKLNPTIQFYAYTKMVALLKSYELPINFMVIYSFGGKQDHLIDVTKDRHSQVFGSYVDLLSHNYADASKNDSVALGPNKRIGLVYHGAKSKNWETNERKIS